MVEMLDKFPDDFFDTITDVRECRQYWTLYAPGESLIKMYLNLDLRIHIHIRGQGAFGDYCAVMGYKSIVDSLVPGENVISDRYRSATTDGKCVWGIRQRNRSTLGLGDSANDMNESVFVGVVELLEDKKRLKRYASSFVRLDSLDHCHIGWGDSEEFCAYGISITLPGCVDRKFESFTSLSVEAESADGLHEHVECGSGVVGKIPNDQSQVVRDIVVDPSPYDVLRRIGVSLFDTGVGLRIDESFALGFERIEVFVCPAKFGVGTIHHSRHKKFLLSCEHSR
jgi:hypothetical protein